MRLWVCVALAESAHGGTCHENDGVVETPKAGHGCQSTCKPVGANELLAIAVHNFNRTNVVTTPRAAAVLVLIMAALVTAYTR